MIWLVCGGRSYGVPRDDPSMTPAQRMDDFLRATYERTRLFNVLDEQKDLHEYHIEPVALVIHGAAPGADSLAKEWADLRGIAENGYPADWTRFGRKAGPIRNQRMLDQGKPDIVIAFPGGRGTADMVRRARTAGIPALEVT